MGKKGKIAQVKSGLRMAAAILIFVAVGGLFVAGVNFAFFPTEHPRILGWVFLIISTPIMVLEMNRWVRVFPGLLAYAVLNGIIVLSTGHALGKPSVTLPWLPMLGVTSFYAVSAALSLRFKGRKLNWVDRIAVLAYVFILVWLWVSAPSVPTRLRPLDYLGIGSGIGCLLFAWVYDRIQSHRAHGSRRRVTPGTAGVSQVSSG